MKPIQSLIALVAIALLPVAAPSQDLPKATKHDDASWYYNISFRFKNGRADEALKIIQQYFVPTDKAVGREVVAFHCQSGRWDMIVFIPMVGGVADLGWKISPANEKWVAALAKVAGGTKQALDVFAKWDDVVADSDRTIVFRQN